MRVRHGDVGLVEGGTNLAAVGAMADMTVDKTGFLEWLKLPVSSGIPGSELDRLTKTSCTAPQKQVAVASSSLDQPSFER
jgi:hypothetical protein